MHVGFDLLFLVPGASGGRETYARELLGALRARGGLRLTTFINAETAAAGPGFWSERADATVVLPRASGARRGAWALGELAALPRAAAGAGVDVLHSPANFAPLHGAYARVLTLHDLLHRERPELVPAPLRLATDGLVRPAVARAHRVITVSRASAGAIARELNTPPDRIDVIPNGLAPVRTGDAAAARRRLDAGYREIALAVATDLPHKNLAVLPRALAAIDVSERPLLAIAGQNTDSGALPGLVGESGVGDDVRVLGAVSPGELEDLYAAASAFVTPTLYEGFGFPVLEALARGLPVVASDLPVLREVAGGFPVLVDPRDPAALAGGLRAALSPLMRTPERIEGARRHAAGFTWAAAAEATVTSYGAAVARARRAEGAATAPPHHPALG